MRKCLSGEHTEHCLPCKCQCSQQASLVSHSNRASYWWQESGMPGKIKSHSLTTRMPVRYVCKGIIWAIIVQEPCGLINTVYILFSSWFWKPGYFPGEKVNKTAMTGWVQAFVGWCAFYGMAMLSEIPPDKTVSHGDHLLLWILISPHTWHNTVCATEVSAWGRQASLPSSFKLVQYRCDIFHKVLVP